MPSGRIVTVRTRLGSFAPGVGEATAGCSEPTVAGTVGTPGIEACGKDGDAAPWNTTGGGAVVIMLRSSTGCSSRDTTRSFAPWSRTRSWMVLLDC